MVQPNYYGHVRLRALGHPELRPAWWALPSIPTVTPATPSILYTVEERTGVQVRRPFTWTPPVIELPGCPWFVRPLWPHLTHPTGYDLVPPSLNWKYALDYYVQQGSSHCMHCTGWVPCLQQAPDGQTFTITLELCMETPPTWTT